MTSLSPNSSIHLRTTGTFNYANYMVSMLKAQVQLLTDKCEDLEGSARTQTKFVAQLLKEVIGLDKVSLLDHVHRTLWPKPYNGDQLCPFVNRVHFFHVRNDILCWAADVSRTSPLLNKIIYYSGLHISSWQEKWCIFFLPFRLY